MNIDGSVAEWPKDMPHNSKKINDLLKSGAKFFYGKGLK
jgi:hypothetical protein